MDQPFIPFVDFTARLQSFSPMGPSAWSSRALLFFTFHSHRNEPSGWTVSISPRTWNDASRSTAARSSPAVCMVLVSPITSSKSRFAPSSGA